MKTKISHLGRSTVSVILAVMMLLSTMLIGTISVNAYSIGYRSLYYANTLNWNTPKLQICSGDNYYNYDLTKIDNTNIYYRSEDWNNYTWFKFNDGNDYDAPEINANVTSKTWYSGKSDVANTDFGKLNSTSKVVNMVSSDGNNYVEQSIGGTTVISGYNLPSDAVSTSAVSSSTSSASSNASIEAAFGSTITYSAKADSNYEFKGFSTTNSSSLPVKLNTNATMTQTSSAINGNSNDVYYAYYVAKNIQTPVAESVKLTASSETVTSGGSTKLTATLKNKTAGVGNVTYTFKTADGTEVGTVKNTDKETASVEVKNITSDTTYTVTVSATDYSNVTDTARVTVKQLENWYLMGTGYGEWNKVDDKKYNLTRDSATGCYYYDTTGANTGDVYFRFHDGKDQYCPDNDQEAIALGGEKLKITKSTNTHAFKYNNTVSNYRIWLDSSNASDIKVWITDITKKYNISNDSGKELTISPNQASAGEKVTVTAAPTSGEVLKSVTVVGEDDGASIKTTVSGNKATFTMPDQNVTVTGVNFRDAKTCKVTFGPSDEKYGDVTAQHNGTAFATGNTVTEGDTVTFTATQSSGYTFKDWTVTVNNEPKTYTDSSLSLNITADTDVVANFVTGTQSKYYLLCGEDPTFKAGSYKSVPLIDKGNGEYYADFDVVDGIPKKTNYYIIFSRAKDTSGIIDSYTNNNNNVEVIVYNKNGFSFGNNYSPVSQISGNNYVEYAKVHIGNDEVTGFTVKISNLNIDDKSIKYSAEPKFYEAPANTVEITAKDGTIRAGFTDTNDGKSTAVLGKTSLSITTPDNTEIATSDLYKIDGENRAVTAKNVPKGSTVTVTTTIKPDADFAGHKGSDYYVKGFVVNGESYGIQSGANETGAYTLEYQIPEDVDDGTNFEITPVYFLKDNSNCVTFYVEGFDGDVQKSWGNTIACYPYYQGVAAKDNAFGAYPGQPLLYEGGKYYTQIPKSITLNGVEKKIVGMTLNNFALESVHNDISPIKDNKQSYDYDDFVRIANNNYGNNIIYTFKYSTVKDNFDTKTVSPDTITKAEFDSPKGNGWEDLTDYNHRKVDLFGDVLTDTDSKKDPLLVVSNGYFENYQGFYATEWTVYEHKNDTYSKIAQIPSSALLLSSKADLTNSTSDEKYMNPLSSYADAYGRLENYRSTPAQITFESSINRGRSLQGRTNSTDPNSNGEPADRVDGRWYYSKVGEKITAKIAVEYGDTATSSFTKDPFEGDTNKTTTIGAHAYFTNDAAYGETTCNSNIDSSNYFTFTADTIATVEGGQNYVFLGWYLLSDNKYTKLTDAKAPMTGSDTFVARYVKAPEGTVTIDHKLFSAASNPTPTQNVGTGSGKCYVTVKVFDKTAGKFVKEFAETEKSVTLDGTYINSAKNYELQITLRTVTSGQDKFQKFYYLAQDKQTYNSIDTGTTTTTTTEGKVTTVTRKVDIRDNFFKLNDDGITYSFRNETGSDSIHYYSDIEETKIPYKITFNYEPRLTGDAKQYVVTGEFTSEYILKYGAKLTPEFVMSVAPYEDNFFNTIKWDNDNITINNDTETKTAVVNSTTSLRTVTVKALDVNGDQIKAYELNGVREFTSTVVYGKLLKYENLCELTNDQKTEIANGREYIYVAKPEYDGKKFSYWQISTSPEKTDTSAYVTKCFSQEFNYIAYNDYYIWPVYGGSQSITGASTTLNFLDYSRNQSTDENGNTKTDRVFADFALAFDSNGIQLQTYKGDNIKVGMFLEVCGDLKSDSNGNVITDIDQYKDKPEYSTSETDLKEIKRVILEGSTTKNLTYTTADGITRKLLNKPIDINSLDNKNRIEYYVGYNNNPNNQKKLMRAYSYVIVDNEITLCSTPYSFVNYYNVGNKTYTVS